jgi:hypothetical protein
VPPADRSVEAGPSPIAGFGLFASAPLPVGLRLPGLDLDRLNHSCEPNLGWTPDGVLALVRDVPAGAELTVDYATFVDDPDFAMMCHCGTYRCRQMIEGTDWRIPQLQRRYAGLWAPAVQLRINGGPG